MFQSLKLSQSALNNERTERPIIHKHEFSNLKNSLNLYLTMSTYCTKRPIVHELENY